MLGINTLDAVNLRIAVRGCKDIAIDGVNKKKYSTLEVLKLPFLLQKFSCLWIVGCFGKLMFVVFLNINVLL